MNATLWISAVASLLMIVAALGSDDLEPADDLPEPPEGMRWQLVWNDEFEGDTLDDTKWEAAGDWERRDGWWMKKAVYLDGEGHLVISTEKDGDRYIDGCVRTRGRYEKAFGYFVARVKLHTQPGHWNAFWLYNDCQGNLGEGAVNGAEIDIYEKPWLDDRVNHAIHWNGYGEEHQSVGYVSEVEGLMEGWHTYALWWSEDAYIFLIDGQEVWRTSEGGICREPLYIKLSDEIGSWAGDIAEADLPDNFMVDYVRVYDLVPTE